MRIKGIDYQNVVKQTRELESQGLDWDGNVFCKLNGDKMEFYTELDVKPSWSHRWNQWKFNMFGDGRALVLMAFGSVLIYCVLGGGVIFLIGYFIKHAFM